MACRGSSSSNNTGPGAVAYRGDNSSNNTGLAGGMSRQPQQQQQWSRGGGIPHQHQRSSHTVPPSRQARQQQSRGTPSIGVGGIYDCGSNAVYDQEDSPPPPGAPMCAVYRCGRCGKHGHKSEHCAAPRRFEGTCGACGQYGHMWRNCALSSRQPHLNVFTSSGECYVTDAPATPYTTRRTHLPRQAHRCVRYTLWPLWQTWAQVRTLCCTASV